MLGGQTTSASRAPTRVGAKNGCDRGRRVAVVRARLAGDMGADRVDDELCPLDRGSPVTCGGGGALGDDVTVVQFALSVSEAAVVVGAGDSAHEATAGPKIELDVPLAVSLPEVEAVAVDLSGPLLGCQPAVTAHDDSPLVGEPRLQLGVSGVFGRGDALAFG